MGWARCRGDPGGWPAGECECSWGTMIGWSRWAIRGGWVGPSVKATANGSFRKATAWGLYSGTPVARTIPLTLGCTKCSDWGSSSRSRMSASPKGRGSSCGCSGGAENSASTGIASQATGGARKLRRLHHTPQHRAADSVAWFSNASRGPRLNTAGGGTVTMFIHCAENRERYRSARRCRRRQAGRTFSRRDKLPRLSSPSKPARQEGR